MIPVVNEMRAKVAYYFRYQQQCPLVAIEASTMLQSYNSGGQADVMAINKKRHILEVEIKISIADMRKDIHKPKHYWMWRDYFGEEPDAAIFKKRPLWEREVEMQSTIGRVSSRAAAHQFYFAVPADLANKAKALCETLYPYAGLLIVNRDMGSNPYYITTAKKAKHFDKPRATPRQLMRLAKEMSATVCRLAMDLAGVKRI